MQNTAKLASLIGLTTPRIENAGKQGNTCGCGGARGELLVIGELGRSDKEVCSL